MSRPSRRHQPGRCGQYPPVPTADRVPVPAHHRRRRRFARRTGRRAAAGAGRLRPRHRVRGHTRRRAAARRSDHPGAFGAGHPRPPRRAAARVRQVPHREHHAHQGLRPAARRNRPADLPWTADHLDLAAPRVDGPHAHRPPTHRGARHRPGRTTRPTAAAVCRRPGRVRGPGHVRRRPILGRPGPARPRTATALRRLRRPPRRRPQPAGRPAGLPAVRTMPGGAVQRRAGARSRGLDLLPQRHRPPVHRLVRCATQPAGLRPTAARHPGRPPPGRRQRRSAPTRRAGGHRARHPDPDGRPR